eukprot:1249888-Rhodomonas_salina.4
MRAGSLSCTERARACEAHARQERATDSHRQREMDSTPPSLGWSRCLSQCLHMLRTWRQKREEKKKKKERKKKERKERKKTGTSSVAATSARAWRRARTVSALCAFTPAISATCPLPRPSPHTSLSTSTQNNRRLNLGRRRCAAWRRRVRPWDIIRRCAVLGGCGGVVRRCARAKKSLDRGCGPLGGCD